MGPSPVGVADCCGTCFRPHWMFRCPSWVLGAGEESEGGRKGEESRDSRKEKKKKAGRVKNEGGNVTLERHTRRVRSGR
jgi:hypothetical protein